MAVGDNLNDLEMLEFAGTGVVMGNATEALKSRGYRLTGTNDEGGLAAAIRLFALNVNQCQSAHAAAKPYAFILPFVRGPRSAGRFLG